MAKFKAIVSDPEDGTSKIVELEEARATALIGRRVGEIIDGTVVDQPGNKIKITGGSDKDGFPMRGNVHGGVRRRVILSGGTGFNPDKAGKRKRKTIRGNIITDEIVQINLKIVEKTVKKVKEPKKTKENKAETEKKETSEKPAGQAAPKA